MDQSDVDGTVERLLGLMFRANDGNGFRFSFNPKSGMTLRDIIESDILETDLDQLHNSGASFAINKIKKDYNGEFKRIETDQYKGRVHTGWAGENPSKQN